MSNFVIGNRYIALEPSKNVLLCFYKTFIVFYVIVVV